jgi:hypothetical protein
MPITGNRLLGARQTHEEEHEAMGVSPYDSASWPMVTPFVLSAPPVLVDGVAAAASAIASSVLHSVLDGAKFTVLGGPRDRGLSYPNYLGAVMGTYPQITSAAQTAVEFNIDTVDATGRFEIYYKSVGAKYRILIKQTDGSWGAITQFATRSPPADGVLYHDLLPLGAAGTYVVRIEFAGAFNFFGVKTGPTDTVTAYRPRRRRYIVVGDSFTEPTFSDSGTTFGHYGWVQQLAMLTGFDIWSAGSGGTGYVKTNGARPKFFDRLTNDVLAFDPDGIIFAGGINDTAENIVTFRSEVAACLAAATGREKIVLSPFEPKGINGGLAIRYSFRDVLSEEATNAEATFLDLLNYGGVPEFLSDEADFSTTLASSYVSGTSISVTDIPAYFKQANTGTTVWWVKIGSGSAQYVREVVSIAGSGPYTLGVTALGAGVSAGATVTLAGDSYQTGTGRQGATTGSGNSDRYTGSDATHPTVAGHGNIARCVADLWARSLS